METNNFALRDGTIVWVPEVPEEPFTHEPGQRLSNNNAIKRVKYKIATQSAIAAGVEVENQDEISSRLLEKFLNPLINTKLYPLQCRVERDVRYSGWKVNEAGEPYEDYKAVARITFDEQPNDDRTFKCDCHYPCDNYPHCGGHKITFDEQPEKEPSIKVMGQGYHINKFPKQQPENSAHSFTEGYVHDWNDQMTVAAGIEPESAGQEQENYQTTTKMNEIKAAEYADFLTFLAEHVNDLDQLLKDFEIWRIK